MGLRTYANVAPKETHHASLVSKPEAAHNAGAGGDTDKPRDPKKAKSYPPKKGEDNAYSYHYFADDIQKPAPGPKGLQPKEIEVKPEEPPANDDAASASGRLSPADSFFEPFQRRISSVTSGHTS
ncbi:MAG TPA: hypothetical protein VE422_16160 [Terriglobia bacterium]|nr:hypothetical protein [Terriglobia bacterium]